MLSQEKQTPARREVPCADQGWPLMPPSPAHTPLLTRTPRPASRSLGEPSRQVAGGSPGGLRPAVLRQAPRLPAAHPHTWPHQHFVKCQL